MSAPGPAPRVSVVIPAWKRHGLLPRAAESVLAQTLPDWELIISDDEPEPNPNRDYAADLARRDPRVRLVINPGPHGQPENHNFAIEHARAPWVKILHNDDLLEPTCLEEMLRAATLREGVALVACLANDYVGDRLLHRRDRTPQTPKAVLIDRRLIHLAMYVQDVETGVPSTLMVRKSVFDAGARFRRRPDIVSNIDTVFAMEALGHGHFVIVRRPLAQWRQGEYESVTSTISDDAMFGEFDVMRAELLARIDPSLRPPSLETARGLTRLLRVIRAARHRQWRTAAGLLARARRPGSWLLLAKYFRRRAFLNATIVPRETLEE